MARLTAEEAKRAIDLADGTIVKSSEVRASLRRDFPPDRAERLDAMLEQLAQAMDPLRRHLLHSPTVGKDRSDPVRLASRRLQGERLRVRRMLRGYRGGRSQPKAGVSYHSLKGTAAHIKGELSRIETELDAIAAKFYRKPRNWLTTLMLRKEGKEFREELDALKPLLEREKGMWLWVRQAPNEAGCERAEPLAMEMLRLRDWRAALVRRTNRLAAIRELRPRTGVQAGLGGATSWDRDSALTALERFYEERRDLPRVRDLPQHSELPSYGTIHRLFGGMSGVEQDIMASRS